MTTEAERFAGLATERGVERYQEQSGIRR